MNEIICCNVNKDQLFSEMNQAVLLERLGAFRRNLRKNLEIIGQCGGVGGIIDHLAGTHVVVVGAGPSLEKGSALLKKYCRRENLRIIATDMALQPLVSNGIVPRFVISCETTPAPFFDGVDTSKMHLLAFSCMSHTNLQKWKGDVSFYNWMIHGEGYAELWETAGAELGYVATCSLVTTQAVALALGCGPASLAMVGNDLGFYDKFYANDTFRHLRRMEACNRWGSIEAMDYDAVRRAKEYVINRNGCIYYTSNQFLSAKMWLEELFSRQDLPIFDCSEPGCSGTVVKKTTLKQYFEYLYKRHRRR